MPRREDTESSTVDGAAAFERWHGEDTYDPRDDQPSPSDLEGEEEAFRAAHRRVLRERAAREAQRGRT